jgi:hypothetical protein
LDVVRKAHGFHRLILDSLRDRDPDGARRHMAEHILASKKETLALLHPDPHAGESMVLRELPADVLKELEAIERRSQLAAAAGVEPTD